MAEHMQGWQDIYFTSRDGLRLYARHYFAAGSTRRPALCLPGLTRNSRDFHELAAFLSDPRNPYARDVYTIDYRGRGKSAHDPNWQNYSLQVELLDVLDFMTLTNLHGAAIIGTSRGGILAMLMGAARPSSIAAVVLNDIGPVIERDGLLRIAAYVGRIPLPATWDEATALVRDMNAKHFPAVPEQDWPEIARQWFNDDHGRPTQGYDQDLAKSLPTLDDEVPTLWAQFASLTAHPTLVLRGEYSDILKAKTVEEMRLKHPKLEALTVDGEAHAPLLRDRPTKIAIAEFLRRADAHVPG